MQITQLRFFLFDFKIEIGQPFKIFLNDGTILVTNFFSMSELLQNEKL